jgi:CelD/BcsL family acetyltransferase involved in cellulose biosynthesis
MHFTILRTDAEFHELAEEWNDLLTCCSASHVPFLRHEYLSTWWKTKGGGEWQEAELCLATARHEDGILAGIAPLFFSRNQQGEPALLLLGSIEISDYLDLIVRSSEALPFLEGLLSCLAADQTAPWEVLDLYNIPEHSPTLPALKSAAEERGWAYSQERLQPCPYIPLPGDWETYLAGIDKKQRHEVRRKMRRAEENDPTVRWYFAEDLDALDREIEDFLALMAQDQEKERFLTPQMREQMHAAIHAAFDCGWLQLAFLEVGGQKAAVYLNFDYAGHIWVYNSGLNFSFRELSPGWVLLGHLLKWANENQRAAFDFMRGGEDYKYRFGAINRYVVRAVVRRPIP